jgi:isopenicillin-N epimerase
MTGRDPQLAGLLKSHFQLDVRVTYLNHGSFGACPRPVFEAYQRWQLEFERQPMEFDRRKEALLDGSRALLGAYLGVAGDDVVYFPNPTTAVNMVARSLASPRNDFLHPGDEILATDHEYGAMDRTWRFVCQRTGARYVRQRVPLPVTTQEEFVERFWAGVNPRTRVIFISHITSPTALIFPVAEICRRARRAGLLSIVDGAHAPGQIDLNLREVGADFYVGACHKWLCAPKGAAFLYAGPEAQGWLEPLVVSWGWNRDQPPAEQPCEVSPTFAGEQQWQGTRDISAFLSVPAAIAFQAERDWPAVRRACHELLREARQRMEALTGLAPICPDREPADPQDSPGRHPWYAQMAAFPLPPCDAASLQRSLYERFLIEVPVVQWNGRQFVRVSVQGYNTPADLGRLFGALELLLPQATE